MATQEIPEARSCSVDNACHQPVNPVYSLHGMQHVVSGLVLDGDICSVQTGGGGRKCRPVPGRFINGPVEALNSAGMYVYRRIPVAGHHQPDVVAKLAEHGLKPSGFLRDDGAPSVKPTNPKDVIGSDKLPVHLWPNTATMMGCLGFLEGALKYGRSNFRGVGVRASIYYDAMNRHMQAWFEGEDNDPDSGLPHLSHALACIAIIVDAQAAGKLNDDRTVRGGYRNLVALLTPHVRRIKELHKDKDPKHYTIADNK